MAAFNSEARRADEPFSEHVGLWHFDGKGELRSYKIVREDINRRRGTYYGRLLIESSIQALYILSAWLDINFSQTYRNYKSGFTGKNLYGARNYPDTILGNAK